MASAYPAGLGNDQQAMQATAAMRHEPWYQEWAAKNGLKFEGDQYSNPSTKLSDDQRSELAQLAQAHGIGMNHKYDQIDENGQISEAHHKLKKIAIGAAIGGLALTGLGAAGIGPLAGVMGGAGAAGGATAAGATGAGATGAGAGTGVLGGITGAIGTGSKIAGLFNTGKSLLDSAASGQADKANQLANDRLIEAKVAQAGPASDQVAFRNAMRSGLVARMNPNAAPVSINGHELPSLANPDTVGYAGTMFSNLRDKQALGQAPTEFGVPPASQAQLDASSNARLLNNISSGVSAGSQIANLFRKTAGGTNVPQVPIYGPTDPDPYGLNG